MAAPAISAAANARAYFGCTERLQTIARPPAGGLAIFTCRTRSGQRVYEHAVAALEVELRVAAAAHRDVLLLPDRVRDRHRVRAGAALEAPQELPGLRVERLEEPV